jgi:hypothetical protein
VTTASGKTVEVKGCDLFTFRKWRRRATIRRPRGSCGFGMSQSSIGQKPPEFLSTHPSDETRIKQIEMWVPSRRCLARQSGADQPATGWIL